MQRNAVDVAIAHVLCAVMATVNEPTHVSHGVHDAVEHADETECGGAHVAEILSTLCASLVATVVMTVPL